MPTLQEAFAVAAGGAVGSLGRWAIGLAVAAALPATTILGGVPVATLAANVFAGLIIGFANGCFGAFGAGDGTAAVSSATRLLVTVGLCGGLSTFSTFSNETLRLIEAGNAFGAAANIVLNVAICLVAVWLGYRLAASFV